MAKIELTQEQIEKAGGKEQLRRVELPLDDDGNDSLEVIVCVPDRRTMGQYLKYQNNANRFYNLILVRIFSISFNLTLFRS